MVRYSSRFCPWCRYIIQDRGHYKIGRCPSVKCSNQLPLVVDYEHKKELWYCRCFKCSSIIRNDYKYCELCGDDCATSIKEAGLAIANKQREEMIREEERKNFREQVAKMKEQNDKLKKESETLKLAYSSLLMSTDDKLLDRVDEEMIQDDEQTPPKP